MSVGDIMKKMNGWGLRFELVFIMIFLICLLVTTIGLNKFGLLGGSDNDNDLNKVYFSYKTLENKMTEAAKRYYQNNYDQYLYNDAVIRSYTLIYDGYMSEIVDEFGNKCSGYTIVKQGDDGLNFKSYINCPKYKTEGYVYE